MKTFTRTMIFGLATLAMTGTAGAVKPARTNDAALLHDSRDMVAWHVQNTRGIEKTELKEEERRLQGLIDQLERGRQAGRAHARGTASDVPPTRHGRH